MTPTLTRFWNIIGISFLIIGIILGLLALYLAIDNLIIKNI